MNVQYLWSAHDILRGDVSTIVGLLEHVRHAYGHHLATALKGRRFPVGVRR